MSRTPEQQKKAREYQAEYQKRPEEVKKRMARNQARYQMEKKGLVEKGDGKDVDHKTPLRKGGSNEPSNLRVVSASTNRGWRDDKKK